MQRKLKAAHTTAGVAMLLTACVPAMSFQPTVQHPRGPVSLHLSDDDVSKQLERARQLIEKSKSKMEDQEDETPQEKGNLPFFASRNDSSKKEQVTKAVTDDGLITTDGEKMAELSEGEEWQVRPLGEVFENEAKATEDPLAKRDVAASIFMLQRTMQTEDFKKIFDSRNRWIGEQ